MISVQPVRVVASIVLVIGAITTPAQRMRAQLPAPLPAQHFTVLREIILEESDAVLNVSPRVSVDADGGFVVADGSEVRARLYRADGRLIKQFGRRGRGPGEFRMPVAARRLPSRELLVVDFSQGIVLYDSSAAKPLATMPVALMPVYGALPLSSDRMLLAARTRGSGEVGSPLLHVWDRGTQRIERSFFPTPGDSLAQLVARNFGGAAVAMRGDTIAAIASLVDTVYLFLTDGTPVGRVPLPIADFKRPRTYSLPELNDPVRRSRWLEQMNLLTSVHWLADGSFLVQYEQPRGAESAWNLVHATRAGKRIFDLHDTPQLLATDGNVAYFVHPEAEAPNRWLVARVRSSR